MLVVAVASRAWTVGGVMGFAGVTGAAAICAAKLAAANSAPCKLFIPRTTESCKGSSVGSVFDAEFWGLIGAVVALAA